MKLDFVTQYMLRAFHAKPTPPGALMKAAGAFAERESEGKWVPITQVEVEPSGVASNIMALTDESKGRSVRFGPRFVDATFQQIIRLSGAEMVPVEAPLFEAFLDQARKHLATAIAVFPIEATRLACVRSGLVFEGVDFEAARKGLCSSPADMPEPFEWDWRCAWTVRRTFGRWDEPTNTIAGVRRVTGNLGLESRQALLVTTDVNTAPEVDLARFDVTALADFVHESPGWHQQIDAMIDAAVSGGKDEL